MEDLLGWLFWLATVFIPIIVFSRVIRRPRVTRREVLLATTFAGTTLGLILLLILAFGGTSSPDLAWVLATTGIGLLIGVVGLIGRAAGVWLSRAP